MKSITSNDILTMEMWCRFCRETVYRTFVQLGGYDRKLEHQIEEMPPVYVNLDVLDGSKIMSKWIEYYNLYGHPPFLRLENFIVNLIDSCSISIEHKDWTIKKESLKHAFVILYHFEGFICSILDVYELKEL